MTPRLQVLHDEDEAVGDRHIQSELLATFYGGQLRLPLATPAAVVANFVTTVDGVTTFDRDNERGTAAVSAGSEADRLLMAMLRAAADVILIGAATLRVTANHRWIPAAVAPWCAAELEAVRLHVTGSTAPPPLVVVSARGDVPVNHPGLHVPGMQATVVTTEQGARRLGAAATDLRVVVAGESGTIPADDVLAVVQRELSPGLVLTEGGPVLLGSLLSAARVTELFLTISPLIAGRSSAPARPGLVDGFGAEPAHAPRLKLLSLRRAEGGPLFFRYRLGYP